MQKAVFLDRDGVINDNSQFYYIFNEEQLKYNTDILDGIKRLSDAGYLVIVISNQGGIARGYYDTKDVDALHDKIAKDVSKSAGEIIDFYYCPHHDKLEACLCRKPSPLLIERAVAAYNIDISSSFLIGDSDRDIEAGKKAGLKSCFKIESNTSCKEIIDQIVNS
jgi:D-glycero-D-manno-heptose 1,7-bisphosphate phosphatase